LEYLLTAKAPSHILRVAHDETETILACVSPRRISRWPRHTGPDRPVAGFRQQGTASPTGAESAPRMVPAASDYPIYPDSASAERRIIPVTPAPIYRATHCRIELSKSQASVKNSRLKRRAMTPKLTYAHILGLETSPQLQNCIHDISPMTAHCASASMAPGNG